MKTALPLEDSFNDILGKAMRGQRISELDLAGRAEFPLEKVRAALAGQFEETETRRLAQLLGLSPDAIADLGKKAWRPADLEVDGLAQFTTPWEDMMVNSYVAWDPRTLDAAIFDTGADATAMLDFLQAKGLRLSVIALTHSHGDHIFDLDRLKERTGVRAIIGSREPVEGAEPIADKEPFKIGNLWVHPRLTWGHSKGGVTYVVQGLARTVAVVGDAIFAGSMGGGMVSYADALRTNREEILTLPANTVLCPGHGPMTTVEDEKKHNPFFGA